LAGERFVLFPRSVAPALYDQIAAICRSANFSPRVRHEALEWETLTGLVGAGLGVSIAPASVRRLRWRGVVYRPLTGTSARTSIVVCRRRAPVAATVEGFVQILRGVAAKAK
jgi:DNA-binding transcriptional LysR family regulator